MHEWPINPLEQAPVEQIPQSTPQDAVRTGAEPQIEPPSAARQAEALPAEPAMDVQVRELPEREEWHWESYKFDDADEVFFVNNVSLPSWYQTEGGEEAEGVRPAIMKFMATTGKPMYTPGFFGIHDKDFAGYFKEEIYDTPEAAKASVQEEWQIFLESTSSIEHHRTVIARNGNDPDKYYPLPHQVED